jgi:hypothetical protein
MLFGAQCCRGPFENQRGRGCGISSEVQLEVNMWIKTLSSKKNGCPQASKGRLMGCDSPDISPFIETQVFFHLHPG